MTGKLRTMEAFSAVTGLSRPTVSKYFHDPDSVRPTTRARIEQALRDFDYRPNFFAVNQNRRSPRNLGIVVPQLTDPFFAELVRRLETQAIDAGYWPVVLCSHGQPALEHRAIDVLRSLKVAGAIVAPLGPETDAARLARFSAEVPVVLLDNQVDQGMPFVGTDNRSSIGRMVAYLCDTGAPPCFVEMPDVTRNAAERRAGYVAAMTARGHVPMFLPPVRPDWDFERLGHDVALMQMRRGGFPSDTLLCANDRIAIGLLAALHAQGVRVGRGGGLRVAGHDDHPQAQFTGPALTTMAQDYDALARHSLTLLFDLTEPEAGGAARPVVAPVHLPTRLIRRASA